MLFLCSASGVVVTGAAMAGPLRERLSLATAYVALTLLAVTLAMGPWNVIRGRPNPVSFNRRRDTGIWSAGWAVAHTALGLTVHFPGRMRLYFVPDDGGRSLLGLRADVFGAANISGGVTIAALLALVAISNDVSLRSFGTARWRQAQRALSYLVVALTVVHGALYQVLERQRVVLVSVFATVSGCILLAQLLGRRAYRRAERT